MIHVRIVISSFIVSLISLSTHIISASHSVLKGGESAGEPSTRAFQRTTLALSNEHRASVSHNMLKHINALDICKD